MQKFPASMKAASKLRYTVACNSFTAKILCHVTRELPETGKNRRQQTIKNMLSFKLISIKAGVEL